MIRVAMAYQLCSPPMFWTVSCYKNGPFVSAGLVGDRGAALGQQQFNITQAEAENMIQPDRVADDLGREAMAVMRIG
jgi:hypothetical protein